MAYKISGTSSDNATIYVLQNNALVGYKENNYGTYNIVFDSATSSGVIVLAKNPLGEVEGYGELIAISTGEGSNIVIPDSGKGILKTGQTTSFASGDDGDLELGLTLSYTDNGDGTVTDNNTGLMWAKDGNGAGCYNGGTRTWTQAIDFADGLDFANYDDWRLPNVFELFSLISNLESSHGAPHIDTTYFTNTSVSAFYWSSTTAPQGIDGWGFSVGFSGCRIDEPLKSSNLYIRCVRG